MNQNQNSEVTWKSSWPEKILGAICLLLGIIGFVWFVNDFLGMAWIGQLLSWVCMLFVFLANFQQYRRTRDRRYIWLIWAGAFATLVFAHAVFDGWRTWKSHQ